MFSAETKSIFLANATLLYAVWLRKYMWTINELVLGDFLKKVIQSC